MRVTDDLKSGLVGGSNSFDRSQLAVSNWAGLPEIKGSGNDLAGEIPLVISPILANIGIEGGHGIHQATSGFLRSVKWFNPGSLLGTEAAVSLDDLMNLSEPMTINPP